MPVGAAAKVIITAEIAQVTIIMVGRTPCRGNSSFVATLAR